MDQMRTIAIMNNKGGVGKSSLTVNLADILVRDYGKKVAIADCDGQRNATRFYLPMLNYRTEITVKDVLAGDGEMVWSDNFQAVRDGLLLLPGTPDLYELDISVVLTGEKPEFHKMAIKHLREAMEEDGEIDFFFLDLPPGFTLTSCAALVAADEVIIPVLMDGFNFDGVETMAVQLLSMRKANPLMRIAGAVINQWHNAEHVLAGERLLRSMDIPVFNTVIRRTDKMPETTFERKPIVEYSPRSAAAQDIRKLALELLEEV